MYADHAPERADTDDPASGPRGQAGMRAMFWSWMTIVVVGLSVMIAIPWTGR